MATKEKKAVNEQILRKKQESAARALKLFGHAVTSRSFVRSDAVRPVAKSLSESRR